MNEPVARRPLRFQIEHYVSRGYRVVSETPTSAQLVKPKTFSSGWMFFWTFFSLGTLFWAYPIYYLTKKDKQVYLTEPQPV